MKLLVFAHTPPPHHGQSYMVQLLLDGLRARKSIECFHVNSRFSDDLADIGRIRLAKIALLLKYCCHAILLRFRHGVRSMYYIPASPNRGALYRDWLILSLCRPFFPNLIFHWEAAGLAEWCQTKASPAERRISRSLLGRPELSIVLTESNRHDADYFQSRRVAVVPNGVPDPCLEGVPSRPAAKHTFDLLFMGLCTRDKGIFDALEGVALANQRQPGVEFRLRVAGQFFRDPERIAFEKRAADLRFPDGRPQVEYCGFVSGPAKQALFRECQALLFPTYYHAESFPLVLIEAMAHALPVITTNWRMISELLPKAYPFIVTPKSPQQIADALVRLRETPGQWNLRQHYLDHFTERHYIDKMEAALRSL